MAEVAELLEGMKAITRYLRDRHGIGASRWRIFNWVKNEGFPVTSLKVRHPMRPRAVAKCSEIDAWVEKHL